MKIFNIVKQNLLDNLNILCFYIQSIGNIHLQVIQSKQFLLDNISNLNQLYMNLYTDSQLPNQPQINDLYDEQLSQSRFLLEEVNFDEQPTQQQILERAEELQIDDLLLAKQSLTRQLDPEWKPYRNRMGDIYYINLLERVAYIDHPIDMFFKKQYARLNGLVVPKFKSFKLEQVVGSFDLVEQQIRAYKTQSHKTTLNIVYQQPQQQALSSHLKSPINYQSQYFKKESQSKLEFQGMKAEQLQELYEYQKQIQKRQQQQLKKIKEINKRKMKMKEEEHNSYIQKIKQRKLQEYCQMYEEEIIKKNKIDYDKQVQRIDAEYQDKVIDFCHNIHRFNSVFEQLRQKQRSVEDIFQHKNTIERMNMAENIKKNAQLQTNKAIQRVRQKIRKQFNQKLIDVVGNSQQYQEGLKNSLSKLYQQIKYENISLRPHKRYQPKEFLKQPQKQNKEQHRQIKQTEIKSNHLSSDLSYEQLKKQIKNLTLWDTSEQNHLKNNSSSFNASIQSRSYKPSLNLRLRMRII